ncbi:MAG: polysaccharide biosynthesis protein [Chlorobi bacterium]|nr:polysaccharide biosynthesis protein [Chlorobiota bacterium]
MRRISANAGLIFLGDAAARALGFFTTIHLAAEMGKEGYGMVTVGFAILSYALWFSDLGLGTLGTREMARPEEEREFSPGDIFASRLILGIIILIASYPIVLAIYGRVGRTFYIWFLFAIIPYAFSLEWYYQGKQRFIPFTISRFIASAIYFAVVFNVVKGEYFWGLVPGSYTLATLVAAFVLIFCKKERFSFEGFSPGRFFAAIRSAAVIGIGGILAQSVQLLPPLVLGAGGLGEPIREAGVLGAALKIIFVILIIDRVFATVFLPAITRLWSANRAEAERSLERVLRLVIVLGFGIGTVLTIHATEVMRLIYTSSYADGGPTLAILSWFGVATLVNSIFSFGLIGTGHEREYFRATVIGGIATLLLTFPLIHLFGLTGAALAIVGSEICLVALTYAAFRRRVKVRFIRALAIAILTAAGVILAAHYLPVSALPFLPLTGITFLAATWGLGAFSREDILWVIKR